MNYETSGVAASTLISEWAASDLKTATGNGTVAAAIHAACYLCTCAIAAGHITYVEALGDRGLVHELVHISAGDNTRDISTLEATARALEAKLAIAAMPSPSPLPDPLLNEAVEVLREFAVLAHGYEEMVAGQNYWKDHDLIISSADGRLSVGDLRRARTLLSKLEGGE
jgi:hypothetical protein